MTVDKSWTPASGRSPLGLPLPEKTGRQHIPELSEVAAEQGTTRAPRGGDDVRHVCPDCGGHLALIVNPSCRRCGGRGWLTPEEMTRMFGD